MTTPSSVVGSRMTIGWSSTPTNDLLLPIVTLMQRFPSLHPLQALHIATVHAYLAIQLHLNHSSLVHWCMYMAHAHRDVCSCVYIHITHESRAHQRDVPFVSVSKRNVPVVSVSFTFWWILWKTLQPSIKQGQLGLMWVQHCMHAHNWTLHTVIISSNSRM